MPKYLITGGCGFIGSHLAQGLVQQGAEVIIYDNLSSGFLKNIDSIKDKIEFIQADICDVGALNVALKGVEGVFHEAALVSVFDSVNSPEENHSINITGTFYVLRASQKAGVKKVVLASSAAVYGNDPLLPKVETMKPSPESPYALGKLTGEYYARLFSQLYGLNTVSLRYFNVFGPRQDPSSMYSGVISKFMEAFIKSENPFIFGDGLQTRDFVFVKNVVAANLLAMQTNSADGYQVFNVGCGRQISLLDLISEMELLFYRKANPEFKPARVGDIKFSVANIDAIQKSLGYVPSFSLKEGLADYFKYLTGDLK
ncbi:MAG: hypothetical protein ACD_73C00791G0002 [uncultured bacterium]|nr:MAG: hypothetical protein ACD_73C00791G0002 [uncultured bacterium]